MSEYIERGETIGAIVKVATRFCRDVELVANIIHAVETIPAADVRPVVRGTWISHDFVDMGKGRYTGSVECSVCHRFLPMKENYCPQCGADTRGET